MVNIGIGVLLIIQFIFLFFLYNRLNQVRSLLMQDKNKELNPKHTLMYSWEEEMRRTVELQCFAIRNAIFKQTIDLHRKEIEIAPRELTVPKDTLLTLYSYSQVQKIETFFYEYDNYLKNYWLKANGEIKTVFRGIKYDYHSELGQMVSASKQLVYKMDKLLKELRS